VGDGSWEVVSHFQHSTFDVDTPRDTWYGRLGNSISSALRLRSTCNHLGNNLSSELPNSIAVADESLPRRPQIGKKSGEFQAREYTTERESPQHFGF
jgi:hypothetical protein